jgi:hypothetical protein
LQNSAEENGLAVLDPQRVRLRRHAGLLRLIVEGDRCWLRVSAARAFPLSDPHRYFGFLDGDGRDIGLLVDPARLDGDSRRLLEEELYLRYFVPTVQRIESVKEEFGSVYWTAETDRGRAEIIVRNLRDNLQQLSASRVIVTDVDGNRFEFRDVDQLDAESQEIITRSL